MVDEPEQETGEQAAPEEPEAPPEEPEAPEGGRRSSAGFRLGLILGAVAGAAAATLFAPRAGLEEASMGEAAAENQNGALGRLRSRLREAATEAQQAAQEAEQAKRTRFTELIERDQP